MAAFLGLYLEALDEELFTLQSSIIKHKPTSTPKVDELEGEIRSGEGQTEVGERDYTVRRLFYLCTRFSVADVYGHARQVRSGLPSRAYLMEGPTQPYARLASLTLSPSKTGDHSNSTSRSVSSSFSPSRLT